MNQHEYNRRLAYVQGLQGSRRKLFDDRQNRLDAENKSLFFTARNKALDTEQEQLMKEIDILKSK